VKIIKAADFGACSWSPTAVNVERMKRRRARLARVRVFLIVLMVVLFAGGTVLGAMLLR